MTVKKNGEDSMPIVIKDLICSYLKAPLEKSNVINSTIFYYEKVLLEGVKLKESFQDKIKDKETMGKLNEEIDEIKRRIEFYNAISYLYSDIDSMLLAMSGDLYTILDLVLIKELPYKTVTIETGRSFRNIQKVVNDTLTRMYNNLNKEKLRIVEERLASQENIMELGKEG